MSVGHNLKFNCVKMPVFETHFKIFNSCFLYIQHVANFKFSSFRPLKLETLTLLTVKENLYTNLLRTIISFHVNKNYYYIVILFLCYVSPFISKGLVFPLLRWGIPGFYIRTYFFFLKKRNSRRFLEAYCVEWINITYS